MSLVLEITQPIIVTVDGESYLIPPFWVGLGRNTPHGVVLTAPWGGEVPLLPGEGCPAEEWALSRCRAVSPPTRGLRQWLADAARAGLVTRERSNWEWAGWPLVELWTHDLVAPPRLGDIRWRSLWLGPIADLRWVGAQVPTDVLQLLETS